MIPINRGKSNDKNFGMLESLNALIKTIFSGVVGLALLRAPAMTRTDLTALIPKS